MNLRVARIASVILLLVAGALVYHELTKRYGGDGKQYIKLTSPFLKCAPISSSWSRVAMPHRAVPPRRPRVPYVVRVFIRFAAPASETTGFPRLLGR